MVDDPYLIPGTDVLRNTLGITDSEELTRVEYMLTDERLATFEEFPTVGAYDLENLRRVHGDIFHGVYGWAGELRTISMGKYENVGGRMTRFVDPEDFVTRGSEIFSELRRPEEFLGETPEAFLEHITQKYNEVNMLDPFREGNGRAIRAFFSAYAEEAGYKMQFTHISRERWMRASVEAGFGAEGILYRVLSDTVDPMAKARFEAIEPLFNEMKHNGLFDWNDHYVAFPAPGRTVHGLIAVPGRDVCALISDGRVEVVDTHVIGRVPEVREEVAYTEPDRQASQKVLPYKHPIDGGMEDDQLKHDFLERSAVFAESMRCGIVDRDGADEVSGRVVWRRQMPGSNTHLALVDTGEAAYSRIWFSSKEEVALGDTLSMKAGEKGLEILRDARQGRGMRIQ